MAVEDVGRDIIANTLARNWGANNYRNNSRAADAIVANLKDVGIWLRDVAAEADRISRGVSQGGTE